MMGRNRFLLTGILIFLIVFLVWNSVRAEVDSRYENGVLRILVQSKYLTSKINDYLNKNAKGYVVYSESRTAYLKNFRSSFHKGSMTIGMDYDINTRNQEKMPTSLGGATVYSSWVKDSGWIELDIFAKRDHWLLSAYAMNEDIRWEGRNWFTNTITGDLFDSVIEQQVVGKVNKGFALAIGGRETDLHKLILKYGASEIAQYLGQPLSEASKRLERELRKGKVAVFFDKDGLNIEIQMDL